MAKHNFDTENPRKHKPMGKEEVVKDELSGRIAEVRADEQVSADSDHAVQIPEEVSRDADDFENTRSEPTPAEVFASESKSDSSESKSDSKKS